jgi:hypothetical protein
MNCKLRKLFVPIDEKYLIGREKGIPCGVTEVPAKNGTYLESDKKTLKFARI